MYCYTYCHYLNINDFIIIIFLGSDVAKPSQKRHRRHKHKKHKKKKIEPGKNMQKFFFYLNILRKLFHNNKEKKIYH